MRPCAGGATRAAPRVLSRGVFCSVLLVVSLAAQSGFTNIAKGDTSGQQVAKQVTVRTPAEWAAVWRDHSQTERLPQIDFTKNMVVGIFLGSKPSAGHEVEIVGVRATNSELIVEYVQRQPGRGTMAAQILTEPYHLVSVSRHDGTVRFIHVPDTRR
jgi:hypothetical protein